MKYINQEYIPMNKLLLLFTIFLFGFTTPNKDLLYVGDSLTCYQNGWQHNVAKHFNLSYDNISKGGKRTDWMLNRLREQLKTHKYKTIIIYGGVNDAFSYTKNDKTIKNLQEMIDLCNHYGSKPIVIVGYNPKLVMENSRGKKSYINLQSKMDSLRDCKIIKIEPTITRSDSNDGIHLNASGHRKFVKWIINNYEKNI